MKNLFSLIVVIFFVVSCVDTKSHRVGVEDLVSASSETVAFVIEDEKSVDIIVSWINDDIPSKAILSCKDEDVLCDELKTILQSSSIKYEVDTDNVDNKATFIYDRVNARDCQTSFGCSASVNLLQSVTDRRTFVDPSFLDSHDAQRAVTIYNDYQYK